MACTMRCMQMLDAECIGGVSGFRWHQIVMQMSINENMSICWAEKPWFALLDWRHIGPSVTLQRSSFKLATILSAARPERSIFRASVIPENLCQQRR
jgi:hypothetical protein